MTILAAAVSIEKMRSPLSRYCFSSSRVSQANAGILQVVRPQITQLLGMSDYGECSRGWWCDMNAKLLSML